MHWADHTLDRFLGTPVHLKGVADVSSPQHFRDRGWLNETRREEFT
jgi:hypothetical protein